MGNLTLLKFPSIVAEGGLIETITNVLDAGAQSARWAIDDTGGVWQGQRTYQNRLRVVTSFPYVGPAAIIFALQEVGVVLGASYVFPLPEISFDTVFPTEQDTGSFIQEIIPEQDTADGRGWIVTINYAVFNIWHELGNSNIQYGSFDPTDYPPIVRWKSAKYHRSYAQDIQGTPFVNTAGDPLENPPQREESTQRLTIIQWYGDYQEPFAQSFRDTINVDTFLGFNPGTVKCIDIDGERFFTSDYGYVWRVIYEFEIRVITIIATINGMDQTTIYGWQDLVLNAGFRAFGGASGQPGALLPVIIGNVPVTAPVLLNPNGTAKIPGNPQEVQNLFGNQNLYLVFNNYPGQMFGSLNIDPNILTNNQ